MAAGGESAVVIADENIPTPDHRQHPARRRQADQGGLNIGAALFERSGCIGFETEALVQRGQPAFHGIFGRFLQGNVERGVDF